MDMKKDRTEKIQSIIVQCTFTSVLICLTYRYKTT